MCWGYWKHQRVILYWACSKEVAPSKWPAINKIYFVLQYFCILIVYCRRFSTSGIRALSLAQVGIFFFFSKKEGKIGRRLSDQFLKIFTQNQKKQVTYLNSSFKNTQFQKNNHRIWSSKSGDIVDLKSAIFQNFSDGRGNCRAKIFWPGAQISIPILWVEAKWLFQF